MKAGVVLTLSISGTTFQVTTTAMLLSTWLTCRASKCAIASSLVVAIALRLQVWANTVRESQPPSRGCAMEQTYLVATPTFDTLVCRVDELMNSKHVAPYMRNHKKP